MDIHTASHARANLFQLLEQVNKESEPCIITSCKGDGVLISKDDWESIQETFSTVVDKIKRKTQHKK